MKELLEKYKNNLPIILIIVYSMGFAYLNRYFSRFDIAIENYINLTDILFFTVTTLFKLSVFFLIVELIVGFICLALLNGYFMFKHRKNLLKISRKSVNKQKLRERYNSLIIDSAVERNLYATMIVAYVILAVAMFFYTKEYLLVVSLTLPLMIVKQFYPKSNPIKNSEIETKEKKKKSILYLFGFTFATLFCFAVLGNRTGNNVKKASTYTKPIEFYEDTTFYSTISTEYQYIGETSSYIFLYDRTTKKSRIFNKQSITSIGIIDPAIREKELESKRQPDNRERK